MTVTTYTPLLPLNAISSQPARLDASSASAAAADAFAKIRVAEAALRDLYRQRVQGGGCGNPTRSTLLIRSVQRVRNYQAFLVWESSIRIISLSVVPSDMSAYPDRLAASRRPRRSRQFPVYDEKKELQLGRGSLGGLWR